MDVDTLIAMPKTKKPFTVSIELDLEVDAFDADSAVTKIEKALRDGRLLSDDIACTESLVIYEPELV